MFLLFLCRNATDGEGGGMPRRASSTGGGGWPPQDWQNAASPGAGWPRNGQPTTKPMSHGEALLARLEDNNAFAARLKRHTELGGTRRGVDALYPNGARANSAPGTGTRLPPIARQPGAGATLPRLAALPRLGALSAPSASLARAPPTLQGASRLLHAQHMARFGNAVDGGEQDGGRPRKAAKAAKRGKKKPAKRPAAAAAAKPRAARPKAAHKGRPRTA